MLGSMGLRWWPLKTTHLMRRMPDQSSRSLKMILMTSLTTSPLNRATMRPYETHVPAFQICQNLYLLDHMIWYLLTVTFEISRFIFSDEWIHEPEVVNWGQTNHMNVERMKWGSLWKCFEHTKVKRSERSKTWGRFQDEDQWENADKLRQLICTLWQRRLAAEEGRGANHWQKLKSKICERHVCKSLTK